MQTFLPYADFARSAQILDYRRLGKQRVEAHGALQSLHTHNRWYKSPAVKMWEGYEDALRMYMNVCIDEWVARGYRNTMKKLPHSPNPEMPPWFGDARFHLSHQSALVRKFPDYYRRIFPGVPDDIPYFWPTKQPEYQKDRPDNRCI